jgi:hypothetical protein
MADATREFVRRRASDRCEYCLVLQAAIPHSTFHIEHVRARQHSGADDPSNLALACERCNAYKGTNLSAVDPETGAVALLFHPRADGWDEHFEIVNFRIVGRTPTGRATVRLLQFNQRRRIELRAGGAGGRT